MSLVSMPWLLSLDAEPREGGAVFVIDHWR
jgi:hypothetical protein